MFYSYIHKYMGPHKSANQPIPIPTLSTLSSSKLGSSDSSDTPFLPSSSVIYAPFLQLDRPPTIQPSKNPPKKKFPGLKMS